MIRNLKWLIIYLIFGGWTGAGAWTGSVVWFSAVGCFSASSCLGAGISFWHLAIKSVKRFCFFSLFCWASFKPCSKASKDLENSLRLNSAVLKLSDISIWILNCIGILSFRLKVPFLEVSSRVLVIESERGFGIGQRLLVLVELQVGLRSSDVVVVQCALVALVAFLDRQWVNLSKEFLLIESNLK